MIQLSCQLKQVDSLPARYSQRWITVSQLHHRIIGFIHHFHGNIVVPVVTNNSVYMKLFCSDKVNECSTVGWDYFRDSVIEWNMQKA